MFSQGDVVPGHFSQRTAALIHPFFISFDWFCFTSFLPLLNANKIHAIEKYILEDTKRQTSWLFNLLAMILLAVPQHSPVWSSPSMTAFYSQLSCIIKWDSCHSSLAVWQTSGKWIMLSSLTISLALCFFLSLCYQDVWKQSILQLCGLCDKCLKGTHSVFASEDFPLFCFLLIWTL